MIIRPACVDDAPAMARVMVDTWLTAHRAHISAEAWQRRKREWTYAVSERGWRETLQDIAADPDGATCMYVALDETGQIVGLVFADPVEDSTHFDATTGQVNAVYVDASHQGRGIGRRLIRAAATHLARAGMTALIIGALAANSPARRFYAALGGRVIGDRMFDEEGFMLPEVVYGWSDIRTLVEADQPINQ